MEEPSVENVDVTQKVEPDEEDKDESPSGNDSGTLNEEVEKEDAAEPIASSSQESEEVSGGPEEIKLPASDDIPEEKTMPSSDENGGVPPAASTDVEPIEIGEAKMVAVEENSTGNIGDSFESLNAATNVGSSDSLPESTGNPNVASQNQRSLQSTSCCSCFGLFEML